MVFPRNLAVAAVSFAALLSAQSASAITLTGALTATYQNNPTLNAARAQLRVVDERVPQALAGWRPTIAATLQAGMVNRSSQAFTNRGFRDASASLQLTQPLFRGFRTVNSTQQAEAVVRAQREDLRVTEQTVLLQASTSYMDVIRDTALVSLRRSDLKFQEEQVRAAKDRFNVGEGTRTDVSQAEAGRARAQSALNSQLAALNSSRAVFKQIIGLDPKNLSARSNVTRLLPKSANQAVTLGQEQHPSILASLHLVDAAVYAVKTAEGSLLPSADLQATVSTSDNTLPGVGGGTTNTASVYGRVTIPIYSAGRTYSSIRQAKEDLGRTEVLVDVSRDSVRAGAISAWGRLNAAVASISAAESEVSAAKLALEGVIEEQRVGQRTTLDVLDSQSNLVNARVTLVTAQRDRVVAAYALLASVGSLDYENLGLTGERYDPTAHYHAVRDKWFGLRTPDGR
ncbi:TolC family outer membrane protein [Polycladidibacter hongkongensis]|uniref:TolC family outer membrane protein n=1 Tax=Polycladidibacter hongkongensis TaxID=1647556 RepID=UPI00082C826E|nr:TolC family outer membrane protein [Pseudovibrio hongkongensis]